jgi:hypothetical protein
MDAAGGAARGRGRRARRAGHRPLPAAALLGALAFEGAASASTIVRPQDLDSLVAESGRAVLGTVVSVSQGYDERGLHATFVTFDVEDPVYGEGLPGPGGRLSFKVYGAPDPMPDGSRLFIEGTPRYRPGDRFFLLLLDESRWGFTGAAGLFQGVFRVAPGRDGRLLARSLAGNRSVLGERRLGEWLDPGALAPGEAGSPRRAGEPVPYERLREAVLELRRASGRDAPSAGRPERGGARP